MKYVSGKFTRWKLYTIDDIFWNGEFINIKDDDGKILTFESMNFMIHFDDVRVTRNEIISKLLEDG
jgi:hypothetical protein